MIKVIRKIISTMFILSVINISSDQTIYSVKYYNLHPGDKRMLKSENRNDFIKGAILNYALYDAGRLHRCEKVYICSTSLLNSDKECFKRMKEKFNSDDGVLYSLPNGVLVDEKGDILFYSRKENCKLVQYCWYLDDGLNVPLYPDIKNEVNVWRESLPSSRRRRCRRDLRCLGRHDPWWPRLAWFPLIYDYNDLSEPIKCSNDEIDSQFVNIKFLKCVEKNTKRKVVPWPVGQFLQKCT